MHFEIVELRCPQCQAVVASLPLGICSWLGQSTYRCASCGSAYGSGCAEWADMSRKSKTWYVGVSLLYVVAIGGMAGFSIAGGIHFVRHGPWMHEMPLGTMELPLATAACMTLIAAVQIGRVFQSRRRTYEREYSAIESANNSGSENAGVELPRQPGFWYGLRRVGLFLILGPVILGWLIALLLWR
jgi:hypothetical protein